MALFEGVYHCWKKHVTVSLTLFLSFCQGYTCFKTEQKKIMTTIINNIGAQRGSPSIQADRYGRIMNVGLVGLHGTTLLKKKEDVSKYL